jgi:predicted DNA-binding transcriptional regulator YafY
MWSAKQAGFEQPFGNALEGALLKLQGMVASAQGPNAGEIEAVFTDWSRGTKDYSDCQAVILDLVEAIVARRRCLVRYQAPHREEPRAFRFDPYRILFIQGLLYCVGHVPVHQSFVALAIDRIRGLTLKEESFTVDPEFDLKKYETEAFGVMREKPMTVVVRFRADQAPYVCEREWHPTQNLRTLRGGRLEMTFRAGGTFEITRWILGWGDAAEVIRPPGLRKRIAAILKSAASCYRG